MPIFHIETAYTKTYIRISSKYATIESMFKNPFIIPPKIIGMIIPIASFPMLFQKYIIFMLHFL